MYKIYQIKLSPSDDQINGQQLWSNYEKWSNNLLTLADIPSPKVIAINGYPGIHFYISSEELNENIQAKNTMMLGPTGIFQLNIEGYNITHFHVNKEDLKNMPKGNIIIDLAGYEEFYDLAESEVTTLIFDAGEIKGDNTNE